MKWLFLLFVPLVGCTHSPTETSPDLQEPPLAVASNNQCISETFSAVEKVLPWYAEHREPPANDDHSLTTEELACVKEKYKELLIHWRRACRERDCGANIAGGCSHIFNSINRKPLKSAIAACGQATP